MLRVINLYIIDKIFSGISKNITASSRMIYINCLIKHFRDLPATTLNCHAFTMFRSDIPNFDKYLRNFQELHKAGLITMYFEDITFNNFWSPYIDKSMLDNSPIEQGQPEWPKKASDLENDMIESLSFEELLIMKFEISKGNIRKLIKLFCKEQDEVQKRYNSLGECTRHCINWMALNSHKTPKETVKSTNKILGK